MRFSILSAAFFIAVPTALADSGAESVDITGTCHTCTASSNYTLTCDYCLDENNESAGKTSVDILSCLSIADDLPVLVVVGSK